MPNLIISNFETGYETDNQAFLLNNTAFPVLNNAYCFRGQIQRKPGSYLLNRMQRDFTNVTVSPIAASIWILNLKTLFLHETYSQIIPGSVVLTLDGNPLTDQGDGQLTFDNDNYATINYNTMVLNVTYNTAGAAAIITYSYYPNLPILGFEDFIISKNFPIPVAFNQSYSFEINQTPSPNVFFDVNYYSFTSVAETLHHFVWSGETYQQFFSASYRNALFVTNGKAGFHFKSIVEITKGITTKIQITNHGLETGDYVYINEVRGLLVSGKSVINGYSFQITKVDNNNFTVNLNSNSASLPTNPSGIAVYLTQSISTTQDGLRYYLGNPLEVSTNGWVNFSPPLQFYDADKFPDVRIDYLIGADIVIPFKDRLLYFGVTIGRSDGTTIYYANRMVYSQNGTPFYAQTPSGIAILTPSITSEPAQRDSWYQNVPAKGGFIQPPVYQKFATVVPNFDVLICGLQFSHWKLIFTGDDSFPFLFQELSSEFGSAHTFSGIALEDGALFVGLYAFALATQANVSRIDRKIRDQIYEIAFKNNADKRLTAIRDFRNEFIYFTAPLKSRPKSIYPSQSFIYNYSENNWATFTENYTHYGYFRPISTYTWANLPYSTWSQWTLPWNYGGLGDRFPNIAAGNQQGFVLIKDVNVKEGNSNYIFDISISQITSPDHCMNDGDFIEIEGVIGTASTELNNGIFKILTTTQNTFTIDHNVVGTYLGGGVFKRIPNFDIKTKMFTPFWEQGLGIRIGVQRYLINSVSNGEITVDIFTSQNTKFASNDPSVSTFLPLIHLLAMSKTLFGTE